MPHAATCARDAEKGGLQGDSGFARVCRRDAHGSACTIYLKIMSRRFIRCAEYGGQST
jgi:hypothetical protein